MKIDWNTWENTLEQAEAIYLSTSVNDAVSARPVSPLNIGRRLYIRTSAASRKGREMLANPHIAGCVGPFYFTGKAKSLGLVSQPENTKMKEAYLHRYPDAFGAEDEFIQPDEVFFELVVETLSQWLYEGGVPVGLAEERIETSASSSRSVESSI